MAFLWTLRGLSLRELIVRTYHRSWDDEVFGQSARLGFYYFVGIFPALLLLLVVLHIFAGTGTELHNILLDSIQQIVPPEAAALIAKTDGELNLRASIGAGAISVILSAAWAILNGTWAMMSGLNTAYGVKEERSWWRIVGVSAALTVWLAIMGLVALGAMLYGSRAGSAIYRHLGLPHLPFFWRILQWAVILMLLLLSLASIYRFAPNLRDRRWQWSTPGAALAIVLWVTSTLLLRICQEHFHSSQRIYADLKPIVTILLWLYFTGASIFIGGEANSEIEKAAVEAGPPDVRERGEQRSDGDGLDRDLAQRPHG